MNISTELLTEVLGKKAYWTKMFGNNYIEVHYDQERYMPVFDTINIYELAHKCKRYMYEKGWLFQVRTGNELSVVDIANSEKRELFFRKQVDANTEPEAIFKACEWILKQKENK